MIKIIALVFIVLNYKAFTIHTPISREIKLLLFVFVLDVAFRIEPELIIALFGKIIPIIISSTLLVAQVVLLSICYLKNQQQVFVNHYIFLAFLGLIAVGTICFAFTQKEIFQFVQLLASAGAVVFGLLNFQYKKQQQ